MRVLVDLVDAFVCLFAGLLDTCDTLAELADGLPLLSALALQIVDARLYVSEVGRHDALRLTFGDVILFSAALKCEIREKKTENGRHDRSHRTDHRNS